MKICILDPGLEDNQGTISSNLGDLIIQEAIKKEIRKLFSNDQIISISTQSPLQAEQIDIIRECDYTFVGGTNLLSSYMNKYKQWNISIKKTFYIKNLILFGVGWWQYQNSPNLYTKLLLNLSLSHNHIHSVRDSYTLRKLKNLGFKNVVNTGCPTMWPLAEIQPSQYCCAKASNVLVMLTDYYKNIAADKKLLEILFACYEKVYFWPQGRKDEDYIKELNYPVSMLRHSLNAFNEFLLSEEEFDYVGTRLHGGIRCLTMKKRVLILAVDNRSHEISLDTNLSVYKRDDFESIVRWIYQPVEPQLNINTDNIHKWKSQFA
ncbi:polysaccharide pyruvyl transferase family protein [Methylosarcina fibrata]|uniref:polysaccharide pyruvyl transferase family protein n=1 Tax=Methylosarcina fibrata TaxID=105972 RepID=UPI0003AB2BF8|nr:polysaccharide pyruvyl transferase family protein [Methylosarcina fibrata]